jgi:hypothetical protein
MEIEKVHKSALAITPVQVAVSGIENESNLAIALFAHTGVHMVMDFYLGHKVDRNPNDPSRAVVTIYRD